MRQLLSRYVPAARCFSRHPPAHPSPPTHAPPAQVPGAAGLLQLGRLPEQQRGVGCACLPVAPVTVGCCEPAPAGGAGWHPAAAHARQPSGRGRGGAACQAGKPAARRGGGAARAAEWWRRDGGRQQQGRQQQRGWRGVLQQRRVQRPGRGPRTAAGAAGGAGGSGRGGRAGSGGGTRRSGRGAAALHSPNSRLRRVRSLLRSNGSMQFRAVR